jgi:hypothetical protein
MAATVVSTPSVTTAQAPSIVRFMTRFLWRWPETYVRRSNDNVAAHYEFLPERGIATWPALCAKALSPPSGKAQARWLLSAQSPSIRARQAAAPCSEFFLRSTVGLAPGQFGNVAPPCSPVAGPARFLPVDAGERRRLRVGLPILIEVRPAFFDICEKKHRRPYDAIDAVLLLNAAGRYLGRHFLDAAARTPRPTSPTFGLAPSRNEGRGVSACSWAYRWAWVISVRPCTASVRSRSSI